MTWELDQSPNFNDLMKITRDFELNSDFNTNDSWLHLDLKMLDALQQSRGPESQFGRL